MASFLVQCAERESCWFAHDASRSVTLSNYDNLDSASEGPRPFLSAAVIDMRLLSLSREEDHIKYRADWFRFAMPLPHRPCCAKRSEMTTSICILLHVTVVQLCRLNVTDLVPQVLSMPLLYPRSETS